MRVLSSVLLVLSLIWSAYWFIGKNQVETRLTDALGNAPAYGMTANYGALSVAGFPNRFDTTVEDINLRDGVTGFGWDAPFFQVFALSYRPNHLIAAWPQEQTFHFGPFEMNVTSEDMRGSLIVDPTQDLTLNSSRFVATNARVMPSWTDQSVGLGQVYWATRKSGSEENSHDMLLQISDLSLTEDLRRHLDPEFDRPALIEGLEIDASLRFAQPVSVQTVPHLTGLDIKSASFHWGQAVLTLTGTLAIDASGYPQGEMQLHVENWRDMADILTRLGLLQPGWEAAAEPLVSGSDTPETLETTISYSGGLTYFGPLPVGPAPRIR